MRSFSTFRLLLAATGALLILPAQAQDGPLDPSFGEGGRVVFDLGSSTLQDVLVQPDGKLVVAGRITAGGTYHNTVVRLLPDGRLDPTFGENGAAATMYYVYALALQKNGSIITAEGAGNFRIRRFTSSGELDLSFGNNGTVITHFAGLPGTGVRDVTVQPDGRIVAVGMHVWQDFLRRGEGAGSAAMTSRKQTYYALIVTRYTADGEPDPTFGDTGVARLVSSDIPLGGNAVAVQPDGSILAAGLKGTGPNGNRPAFLITRFRPDGTLDPTFGTDGITTTTVDIGSVANALVLLPDGRIVVAGTTTPVYPSFSPYIPHDLALARYLPDGTLDETFGQGGIATTNLVLHDDALDLAVRPDGRLVVAGYGREATLSSPHRFAVVAYSADGALDDSFVEGGVALTSFGEHEEVANAVAVQPDGHVVVAGYSSDGETSRAVLARYLTGTAIPTEDGPGEVALTLGVPFPNPARGGVAVPFSTVTSGTVRLTVHDLLGREVAVLAEGPRAAGAHEAVLDTAVLPAGTYVLRLHAEGEVRTGRFTVVR